MQASIGSLGEESYRELGNELSFDPDRLRDKISQEKWHGFSLEKWCWRGTTPPYPGTLP